MSMRRRAGKSYIGWLQWSVSGVGTVLLQLAGATMLASGSVGAAPPAPTLPLPASASSPTLPAMPVMPLSYLTADTVPHLGRPISNVDAAAAGMTIHADGRGLPAGGGTAAIGKTVFAQQCARCHGDGGRGGSAPELVGGAAPLTAKRPDKTIGLYWPSAATLFDFNWRAMPMDKPGSLSADEAYAVTAYLLFADGIIGETARMDARTLAAVKMPNRNGFRWIDASQPANSR